MLLDTECSARPHPPTRSREILDPLHILFWLRRNEQNVLFSYCLLETFVNYYVLYSY